MRGHRERERVAEKVAFKKGHRSRLSSRREKGKRVTYEPQSGGVPPRESSHLPSFSVLRFDRLSGEPINQREH